MNKINEKNLLKTPDSGLRPLMFIVTTPSRFTARWRYTVSIRNTHYKGHPIGSTKRSPPGGYPYTNENYISLIIIFNEYYIHIST